ncbi:hypothetical protein EWF20_00730 [Sulfolobus sp. S-194]|uniref:RAMP superfamily CRISPR-associated protein n=1 Tax=Sulfolobus sp. S-194 TaxID=2512240 RepID=UPI0014371917|nr:RAMP superfamily CRISPR-associated protein [Sulfolobus sp. S-194]QIW22830.1 hypothetical protein EWF20_00730 [Sulfolobus sp. S-194]
MEFKVLVKNLTSLTVGGGSTIGGADIPLNPMILPPSTVKGVLRTSISNYLPKGYTSCRKIEPNEIKEAHKDGNVCDVCKLFGYPDYKDSGCFALTVKVPEVKKYRITRVKIYDKTQTSEEGSLFTQEIIPPNTEFEIEVHYRDICGEKLLKLLLYSFLSLRFWRIGRNAMVDVKLKDDICVKIKCDQEMKEIVSSLSEYLWGD